MRQQTIFSSLLFACLMASLLAAGTVGRNPLRAPGYKSYDLGLQKNFALTEQLRLQLRFEAFNTFNHLNLGVPNSARNSSLFGTITTAEHPRILQFALRLTF